jgi:hypothetical protein
MVWHLTSAHLTSCASVVQRVFFLRMAVAESRGREYALADEAAMESSLLLFLGTYTPLDSGLTLRRSVQTFVAQRAYMALYRLAATAAVNNDYSSLEVLCAEPVAGALDGEEGEGVEEERRLGAESTEGGSRPRVRRQRPRGGFRKAAVWTQLLQCERPRSLFAPAMSEPSFHWDAAERRWIAIGLETLDLAVRLCETSRLPEAPPGTDPSELLRDVVWTCSFVYDVPPPWRDGANYIAYAAKVHPELSRRNYPLGPSHPVDPVSLTPTPRRDLVISYVANTLKGVKMLFSEETRLAYTPRFALLTDSSIPDSLSTPRQQTHHTLSSMKHE